MRLQQCCWNVELIDCRFEDLGCDVDVIIVEHMWLSLKPDWNLLYSHMYTDWPGIHTYEEINDRLFVNPGRNDNIHDTPAKVRWGSPAHTAWLHQQQYMWQFIDTQVKPVQITMQQALIQYEADLREEEDEIEANKRPTGGRKRWKTKQGVHRLKDPKTGAGFARHE